MRLAALVLVLAACNPPDDAVEAGTDAATTAPTPGVIYAFGTEVQKLRPNVNASTVFGTAIAVEQDTLVVGATVESNNQGRLYVFVRSGNTWTLQQKLQASDPTNGVRFGIQVDVSGDTLIAGAAGENGNPQQGAAYVFTRSGSTWTEQQKITAPDGQLQDRFGQSVRLFGDTAVIGAPGDDDKGSAAGSAYVFVRSGTTWTLQQKLTATDGAANDQFGYGVTIAGDTVAIGSRRDDDGAVDAGSVYVFVRSGTTWTQQQKLTSDSGADGNFGRDVSLSGETLLIGALQRSGGNGAAYVFIRSGTTWSQQAKLTASDGANQDFFGGDVSLFGDTAAVGARLDDDGATNTGSIYLFKRTGTTWTQAEKVKPTDGQADDRFSQDFDLFGTTLVGGSRGDDDLANASGAAYVFESPIVTNGSFETADYTGWTLLESSGTPTNGVYGIASDGQTIDPGALVFDFADGLAVNVTAPDLPHTYDATDGTRVAVQFQNGPETHRMFQTITIPTGCAGRLRWDMEYTSVVPLDDNQQFTAVNVRDPTTDAILATPFKTLAATSPQVVSAMTPFEADLSAFAGQTVRLDFEHQVLLAPFSAAWDNIRIVCVVVAQQPVIEVAPLSHGFGNQRVGTTSGAQTFTITNTGTADLVVTSITTAAPFAVTATGLPFTIAPGTNRTFTATFSPSATGAVNGTISIASNAAGSPTEVAVSGTGTAPAISVAPSSHDFGTQRVGTTSAGKLFTITNTGTAPLVVSSTTTTGPFAVGATSVTIPPSGTHDVSATFSPTAVGAAVGTLRINHDAAGSPTVINLAGTGVQPAISLAPSPLAFGSQRVGTTSGALTLTISNPGSAVLAVSAITTTGPFATPNASFTVPAGGSQNIAVTFTPTASGVATGSVVVAHDAPGGPTTSVGATGTGIQPVISIAPADLDFGPQRVGTTSTAQTFDITNTGSDTLVISTIGATAPFSTTNTLPISLSPSGSTTIAVTFSPTATGTASDVVTITSDAANAPSATVGVTGNGIEPAIAVSPATPFGDVRVDTTATRQVPITNTGTDNLTITALTFTGPFSSPATLPIVIAPNATTNVDLVFAPTATGAVSETLTIASDATTSPTTISLTGTGVEPVMNVVTTSLDFGLQRVGLASQPRTVQLINTGTFPLTVTSVTATGTTFAVASAGFVIAPGDSSFLEVTFTPQAEGLVSETLTVTHDAGAASTVALQGTGTVAELEATPTALVFGDIRVGTTSASQPLTIRNLGLAPLGITAITPTAGFVVTGALPVTVLPNASVTFGVTFTPAGPGAIEGGLGVVTSAGTTTIPTTATAVPSALTADVTSLELGAVLLGEASNAQSIVLTNVTDAAITIGGATSSDPQFVLDPAPSTTPIPPGGSVTFAVRYVPAAIGPASGQIEVVLEGETATEVSIEVAGAGIAEGGGCCSTGGGDGSTSLLLGLALAGVLRRRRS